MMKRLSLILILSILVLSVFFRTYQIVERFGFDHDGDLYSWIVKDIVVNKHPRLIGQLTSAPGIYIGPLFYYSLVPFFLLFNMDPIGAVIPLTIFGILTTFSYYFVLSKLFNKSAGLIAAFLHAILLSSIAFDRRNAPSSTTNLWAIWYFYIIIQLSRGNYSVLPLLGILIGLIWHIHIALLPTLLAIPIAIMVSKNLPKLTQVLYFFVTLFITSLPFIIFESRHHFIQTLSLLGNFTITHGGSTGSYKLILVLGMISLNINTLFLSPQNLVQNLQPFFTILLFSLIIFLLYKRILIKKEIIPLLSWILGVIIFFTFSSTLISEYYFYSVLVIFLAIVSLILSLLCKSKVGRILVISLLAIILIKNFYFFTTGYIYHKGYLERKATAEYISKDSKNKGFPCVGISYITAIGENVGFRYFFYLNNLHLVHPSLDVPVYNIVLPDELSKGVKEKFGHIGVIPPDHIPSRETINKSCRVPNANLTDSMLGYTE